MIVKNSFDVTFFVHILILDASIYICISFSLNAILIYFYFMLQLIRSIQLTPFLGKEVYCCVFTITHSKGQGWNEKEARTKISHLSSRYGLIPFYWYCVSSISYDAVKNLCFTALSSQQGGVFSKNTQNKKRLGATQSPSTAVDPSRMNLTTFIVCIKTIHVNELLLTYVS